MKTKILIILFSLLALFIWSCNEPPPIGPETPNGELSKKVPIGTVTSILSLSKEDPYDSPEGIAIDKRGNMYISNTIGDDRNINQILRVTPDGNSYIYAELPAGKGHATGLVTDKKGNVYVAFYTYGDLSRNGVYRINRKGNIKRLRGSKNIARPNALTFDSKGNLYVTSSYGERSDFVEPNYEAAVWRFGKDKIFKRWLMDAQLDAGPHPVAGTLPGANGIVFYPPNKLYVANTARSSVSMIKIGHKGKAVSIELVGQGFLLMNIDGIAVDVHENIYGVLPPSTLSGIGAPPLPPLVKLNPHTGEVTPILVSDDAFNFNTPTSLTFGTGGPWDRKSVFVANAGLHYGQSHADWANPGVVKVSVGVPGKPGK